MNRQTFAAGVDIGTGGCKATILRSDGAVVASASREYPTANLHPLWSEQNPDDWYAAASACLRETVEKTGISPNDIASVCANGQPHTLVLLDSSNEILRPAIVWNDQRSSAQSENLKKSFGDLFMRVGCNQVNPTWTASMLCWIKENEPQTWRRISKIMLPKDFFRFELTGKWSTDWTDAAGTLLADAEKKQWSEELCKAVDLSPDLLPQICPPMEIAGKITKKASLETGLSEGTAVATGACDPAAELFGSGLFEKGRLMIKLATAGVIFVTSERPKPHPQTLTYPHVLPDRWFSLTGTNSCCSSVRWFRDTFCREEVSIAHELGESPYELMDAEAEKAHACSEGLMYHPYLLGERSPYFDPYLRGSFSGIRANHRKEHFIRSIFEGVSFSLKDCLELLKTVMEFSETDAFLLGGGAKSSLWSQILSDVLCISLKKLEAVDASFGSALMGGVAVSMFGSPEEAIKTCVRTSSEINPRSQNSSHYARRFALYRRIQRALSDIYKEW